MNATLLFSLQTIISAGVFILIYRLFVRNTNAYNWNRFYLLATMIISLFLPHIDISGWFKIEKPIIFYGSLIDFNQAVTITPEQQVQNTFNLSDLIMTGYWLVAVFLLLRFGWGIMRILELAKNDDYKKSGNLRLYPIQRKTTFSFFNWIFIQPQHWEKPSIDYIIRHEQAHVKQMHSLDNLLTEIILVFGWFNPFYYIYRRDLHLLHECQADQVVINSGCDTTTYHQLLMNEVSGNLTYIIVNQFSYSLIKRRFKMISKNKQSRLAGFRILLAIPTAFALMLLFSFTSMDKTTSLLKTKILQPTMQAVQSSIDILQNKQQYSTSKESEIQITPSLNQQIDTTRLNADRRANEKRGFPGGYLACKKYLETESKFPAEAVKPGVLNYIEVSFYVSESGEINNVKVGKGIDDASDKEAIRLINGMPKWIPFVNNDKPTNSLIHLDLIIKPNPTNANLPAIATYTGFSRNTGSTSAFTRGTGVPNSTGSEEDKPYLIVEKNPNFKGGYEAMQKFLSDNIHYPETAKTAGVQGTVFVQFVVSNIGAITNVKILRGIGNGCDEEAIRVVKTMPDWNPGENNGKVVPVMFQIPVRFQLGTSSNIVKTNSEPIQAKPIIDKNGDQPLLVVEQNPEFPGGYPGMQTFLRNKIMYPTLAQESAIQGTVFVQFVVTKTGEISNIRIIRGIGGGCDEEAMRVVREMPKWIPGRQNGEAVSVLFQIPVKFQLTVK